MTGATYLCGGDDTPGARGTDCPSPLHNHPLPDGYVDAGEVAGQRIRKGWSNRKCPACGLYGWAPPAWEPGTQEVRRG